VKELLSNVGSGGGGPAQAVVGGGATGGAPDAAAEKVEEKKEEEKEESDDDMVCSLIFTYNDLCLTGYLFRASVFSINLLEPCGCTPSRARMYLYSSRTFSVTPNLTQSHTINPAVCMSMTRFLKIRHRTREASTASAQSLLASSEGVRRQTLRAV